MNDYNRDLNFDVVLENMKSPNAQHVLKTFADIAEKHLNISAASLYQILLEKEQKNSSGIGEGLAIQSVRVRGPRKPFKILATLDQPLNFNAVDGQYVDLVCMVLSPEADGPYHLRRLSRVSRLLKNKDLHLKLSEADDEQSIRALLAHPEGWLLAA